MRPPFPLLLPMGLASSLVLGCTSAPQPSAPTVASLSLGLEVAPSRMSLNVPGDGSTPDLYAATGSFAASGVTAGKPVRWSIGDAAIATIGVQGVVTALATGDTVVKASLADSAVQATAALKVVDRGGRVVVSTR